nr:hypothetical protein CFP56_07823 [Quercus suber]
MVVVIVIERWSVAKQRETALLADDDALAAGGAGDVLGLGLGRAVRLVRVATARATAVELDAGAGAGDAVAFAGAARRGAGHDGRRGRRVGAARAAGAERGHVGLVVAVILGVVVVVLGVVLLVGDLVTGELGGQLLDGGVGESFAADGAGLMRLHGLRVHDARRGEGATLGDVGLAGAARVAGRRSGGLGGGLGGGDVEGVELAAGGGLDDVLAGRVVGDVVAVDDVVVPVALALLEGGAGEAELALPGAGLAGVLGEGELAVVAVPVADQVNGLAGSSGAEGKVELDGGMSTGDDERIAKMDGIGIGIMHPPSRSPPSIDGHGDTAEEGAWKRYRRVERERVGRRDEELAGAFVQKWSVRFAESDGAGPGEGDARMRRWRGRDGVGRAGASARAQAQALAVASRRQQIAVRRPARRPIAAGVAEIITAVSRGPSRRKQLLRGESTVQYSAVGTGRARARRDDRACYTTCPL